MGTNEVYKVGDHDFSKFSLIPDAILLHDIPNEKTINGSQVDEDEEEEEEEEKNAMGSWYRGQVFYGVKTMTSEGSTAWRGVTELMQVVQNHHTTVPPRLYIYADGGGDRRITFLKVIMALIASFLALDLDELISARPAAGHSFRNPVERCHSIANLGLQGVGMMRQLMQPDDEKILKPLNSTDEIRRAFKSHPQLESSLDKSLRYSKNLVETNLKKLSLKDNPFELFEPATQHDISELQESLKKTFGHDIGNLDSFSEIEKFPKFLNTHTQ